MNFVQDRLRDVDRDFSHGWTLPENQRVGHLAHPDSSSASTFIGRSDVNSSDRGGATEIADATEDCGNHDQPDDWRDSARADRQQRRVLERRKIHQPLGAFHKTPNSPSAMNATRNPTLHRSGAATNRRSTEPRSSPPRPLEFGQARQLLPARLATVLKRDSSADPNRYARQE